MTLNDFRVNNTEVNSQNLVYIDTYIDELVVTNSIFSTIKVGGSTSLFAITSVKMLQMSTIQFSQISSSSADDSGNYMINIGAIDLSSEVDSTIQNCQVSQTTIGFLNFASITNEPTQPRQLEVMDVEVTNSQYPIPVDIFNFERISTAQDFTIRMTRIHFESLSFRLGGNLINMQALISNGLVVIDSTASDITGGSMNVEAFNKQNLAVPAKLSKYRL